MQPTSISSINPTVSLAGGAQAEAGASPIAASLLPEPTCSGLSCGSVASLAALITAVDEQDRSGARELQQTTDHLAMQEQEQRVQAMRQKADDDMSQAWASGLAGMASGALTIGSAFVNAPAQGSSSPCWGTALQGAAKAAPDIGALFAAGYKVAADRDDANAAHFEVEADADLRTYAEAGDDAQSANDSIQKVRDFLDQLQQTESATRLAAAGYRA